MDYINIYGFHLLEQKKIQEQFKYGKCDLLIQPLPVDSLIIDKRIWNHIYPSIRWFVGGLSFDVSPCFNNHRPGFFVLHQGGNGTITTNASRLSKNVLLLAIKYSSR